jgi:hypothetical protein
MLLHSVFFQLLDSSEEHVRAFLSAARKYLPGIDGVEQFSVGTLSELERNVNVRDWHVCLHIGFRDRAAHDAYQQNERHARFLDETQANWGEVRVFDSISD